VVGDVKRAFLLNLDGERELAGLSRDPFRALEDRPSLRGDLADLVRDARLIDRRAVAARSCVGAVGLAFMPTPAALAALSDAGAIAPRAPSLGILRAVNHRQFSYALDGSMEGATYATSVEEIARVLERSSPTGAWLLKRPLGFAGKGRRRATRFDAPAEAFARSALTEEGGVGVEPLFDRRLDAAIHGFIGGEGGLTRGEPTLSTVSLGGSFLGARRDAGDIERRERDALLLEVERVADALFRAGYFGPFGVDVFRYADPRTGADRFVSRCEINARYTMAWAIGMGDRRPDLEGRNEDPAP
jgi:hypothetical protein